MFLHEIIFSYSLTAIQILDFGYVKCTPDFAFIHSFLGIVFGQDVRRGMGKKLPKKCGISMSLPFLIGYIAHSAMSISQRIKGWSVKSRYI